MSLRDIVDVKHGFAFQGEFFRDDPPGDVLLTPGNFAIGGGFKADKFKYYTGPVPDEFVLREGDLIVTMTDLSKNTDTLGYPALVPAAPPTHRYLHNQRLGKIILKHRTIVDSRYLYYLLCSGRYRQEVIASATGTTVRHTSPERIKRFSFRLPPHPEQRAIAHILGALDDKIELNRRMNETLEAMARVLFKAWFVGFEPVRAKMEGRWKRGQSLPGLPAHLYDLFPARLVDSDLGEIPEGWQVKGLDEIAHFLNGLALQNWPPHGDESLPIIKIAQLRAGNTTGADRAASTVPKEYVVREGDVLFSWSGSLEIVVWCGGQGALNQHLFKVTSREYPKWFYLHWIRAHLLDFQAIAAGKATTMGHIQRHHLSDAKVAVPTAELLAEADAVIGTLMNGVISNNLQSRTLAALRDTLLPKIISGELRIRAPESIVAGGGHEPNRENHPSS